MALYTQGKAARTKSYWADIKDTDLHTVYTCPPNCTAELSFLHIVNVSGNNTVKVTWYVAADGYASNFVGGKNMSAAESITYSPIQLYLSSGDRIDAQTTVAGHLDVLLSVTETFVPIG